MPTLPALPDHRYTRIHALLRSMRSWWHMLHVGSVVLVLALSPSSYTPEFRHRTARHIYASIWRVIPWFTALSALLSLVLIRIVVVTALSYGLSQYALQMVVRVLVLELIPLAAALFVALRAGLAFNAGAVDLAAKPPVARGKLDLEQVRTHLTPRMLADAFSVLALATLSSVVVLVLTYLLVYGLSPWGLPGFTRTVGQVFDLPVSLGFILKTLFFSLAVAVVPMAASLEAAQHRVTDTIQPGAVRLFLVLFLLEAASLAVKYI
jgi:phospholipid/cholesterol/gamma-HCH transport system permease protein